MWPSICATMASGMANAYASDAASFRMEWPWYKVSRGARRCTTARRFASQRLVTRTTRWKRRRAEASAGFAKRRALDARRARRYGCRTRARRRCGRSASLAEYGT